MTMQRVRELTADELTVLEEQRDFLLRSLQDLEGEHAAGDVESDDYQALRQDYTARAAGVIRAIETHRARVAKRSPRTGRRKLLVAVAGVVLCAVAAGVLVAQSAGRRSTSDQVTGDIRATTRDRLDDAGAHLAAGRYDEAIGIYDDILATQPEQVEAMTYRGWAQVLSGDVSDGVITLTEASRVDPDYPDAHALLAVAFSRLGGDGGDQADYFMDLARRELDRLEALDPPPQMRELIAPLRAELEGRAAQP